MNNFPFDKAANKENTNSNSLIQLYKQNMMIEKLEEKSNEPKFTQKQSSKH